MTLYGARKTEHGLHNILFMPYKYSRYHIRPKSGTNFTRQGSLVQSQYSTDSSDQLDGRQKPSWHGARLIVPALVLARVSYFLPFEFALPVAARADLLFATGLAISVTRPVMRAKQ